MLVDSEALGHIVNKLSFVKISASVVQLSSSVVEVVLPKPLVDSSIRPPHDTIALLHVGRVFDELARVDSTLFAVFIHSQAVHVGKDPSFVVIELLLNNLVAISQSLSGLVAPVVRLYFNNLSLLSRCVGEQKILVQLFSGLVRNAVVLVNWVVV